MTERSTLGDCSPPETGWISVPCGTKVGGIALRSGMWIQYRFAYCPDTVCFGLVGDVNKVGGVCDDCNVKDADLLAYTLAPASNAEVHAAEVERLRNVEEACQNLVALLLHDGGHRYQAVGPKRACEEAEAEYRRVRAEFELLRGRLEAKPAES